MNTETQIPSPIARLYTDTRLRSQCTEAFAECIQHAHRSGPAGWALTPRDKGGNEIQLRTGQVIGPCLVKDGLWLPLDQETTLHLAPRSVINGEATWWHKTRHDPDEIAEYKNSSILSINGYYVPPDNHFELWPILRQLTFLWLERAVDQVLRVGMDERHSPALLEALRAETGKELPEPTH